MVKTGFLCWIPIRRAGAAIDRMKVAMCSVGARFGAMWWERQRQWSPPMVLRPSKRLTVSPLLFVDVLMHFRRPIVLSQPLYANCSPGTEGPARLRTAMFVV